MYTHIHTHVTEAIEHAYSYFFRLLQILFPNYGFTGNDAIDVDDEKGIYFPK